MRMRSPSTSNMAWGRVFVVVLLLLLAFVPVLHGQEQPQLHLTPIPNYTSSSEQLLPSSQRQDLCERYALVNQKRLNLQDALQGLNLTTISSRDQRFFRLNPETGGIDESYGGITVELMDEFCRRAGCR